MVKSEVRKKVDSVKLSIRLNFEMIVKFTNLHKNVTFK